MPTQQKPIKICFFSPAIYPLFAKTEDIHGGAELQTYFLAKGLSKNNQFSISVITGNYKQKKKQNIDNILIIRSFKMRMNDNILLKFIKSLNYFAQLLFLNPDTIFTTAAHATVGITGFYAKLFNKKHLHRTAHSDDVDLTWIEKNGIAGKFYKYGLENAHQLITQTKEHQLLLKKHHKKEAIIFRNIFDVKNIDVKKDGYILWVSRFANWKRPQLFLNLAKKIASNQFVMICPTFNYNNKDWLEFRQKARLIKNLKFIDQVPFSQIQSYFNKANIFINTSETEGFPNTFLQAAAGKTPIISLNINPDNFIQNYNCGYFANDNFETLLQHTKQLINAKTEQKEKGKNAFLYLSNHHNKKQLNQQFKTIILALNRK